MVHEKPTPSMGGLAMFAGVLVALTVAAQLPFFDGLGRSRSQWLAVVTATSVIVFFGAVDDIKGLSAPSKLAAQIFSAGLLALGGVQLLFFVFPGQGVLSLTADLAVPLTIVLVVAMLNAINLIDGLDGLAAGIVAIAAASLFAYMYRSPGAFGDASGAALLAAVAAGVAVGFLPWNFHPARIFMGDSGAMLLGMLLAAATIFGVGRNPYPPTGGDLAILALPIFLPLLVLAIPFLDVILAIVRRVRRGTGLAHADKEHIHHRLLDVGHSHRRAVLLMYLWSGLISACALAVAFVDSRALIGVVALGALLVFLATLLPLALGGRARDPADPAADGKASATQARPSREPGAAPPTAEARGAPPADPSSLHDPAKPGHAPASTESAS
jgi:UDP-GlcNAc:undecaprenyl-phosphate GlcNAc-1-phosphate transferase